MSHTEKTRSACSRDKSRCVLRCVLHETSIVFATSVFSIVRSIYLEIQKQSQLGINSDESKVRSIARIPYL